VKTLYETVVVFLSRLGAYLYLRLALYSGWSYLYRWIVEDKKKRAPVRRFGSLQELSSQVKTFRWVQDTWREMWDTFRSPEAVQWRVDNTLNKEAGDCDDFSCYESTVINREISDNPKWAELICGAAILTVMWRKDGVSQGHNTVVLAEPSGSVWKYRFYDYGNLGPLVDYRRSRSASPRTVC
jgi:hypothetical protein